MKLKIIDMKYRLIYLLFVSFYTSALFSQEITEENYIKADEEIWKTYEQESSKISKLKKKYPEKEDSLNIILHQLYESANDKNRKIAIKFASVPSGLKRLFWVRLEIPKDTLLLIYNSLPKDLKESDYGKSLLLHINTNQIKEGDKFYDFTATDTLGNNIQFSSFNSKHILFIYDGLGCMDKSDRDYLLNLFKKTERNNFQIIVYSKSSNLAELKKVKNRYNIQYPILSDFKNDHSLIKIYLGIQATPTCFIINKERNIIYKFGLFTDENRAKLEKEIEL